MIKIPRIKREAYLFIANLKSITATEKYPESLRRYGYLLSEYYTSSFYLGLADLIRKKHRLLISDNGNFSLIKRVARPFKAAGHALLDRAEAEQEATGKLSATTLEERRQLMEQIAEHCRQAILDRDLAEALSNQLRCKPRYLIAFEDLTIPAFMICGMLHEVFSPTPALVRPYQEATADLYTREAQGEWGHAKQLKQIGKFAVLHSFDYNTARQGAQVLKQAGAEGIAISYGAAISSRRWITSLHLGDQKIGFSEKLPESYLASLAISLGYYSGNPSPDPVHILGIGSPILIAMFGLQFMHARAVSIDSTAPFKDAFQGNIYGRKAAFLKMDMYKVAAQTLIDKRKFRAPDKFFRGFEKKYPSNWKALRAELGVSSTTNRNDLAKVLAKETDLVDQYIPFFAKMRGGNSPMIEHLRVARSGMNYEVLRRICLETRRRRNHPKKMKAWLGNEVERYRTVGSRKWATTVDIMFQLTCAHLRL